MVFNPCRCRAFVSYPLIQQGFVIFENCVMELTDNYLANSWVGYGLCYMVLSAIYYSNAWNVSRHFTV